ncbi:hypothetical protein ACFXTI_032635 [Malus domestica]
MRIAKPLFLSEGKDKNMVFSPLSIHIVLSLIAADGSGNGGPSLSFPNGLWVDEFLNIKPSFKVVVDVFHKAVANKVNFKNKAEEVRIKVNSWAEEETGVLIKEFFTS